MRINKFIAQATGIGRRPADTAIASGRVRVNGSIPTSGQDIAKDDVVTLDGRVLDRTSLATHAPATIMLNKPPGYVVSRDGQGNRTVYDLLPAAYRHLKPVGRLDKDSSGLLLLTSDGQLAFELTHPSKRKTKVYEVTLDKPLQPLHHQMIYDHGITLADGLSKLQVERMDEHNQHRWRVTMHEGRNRQIRRTFAALGYTVTGLHRTDFGNYHINNLPEGKFRSNL